MNKKILVVEDESHIRGFIVVNLSISNFHVIEASSGEEALNLCKSEKPDLVVLDIMLPGIDGYEVCKGIRKDFPDIFIIMLTAKGQDMDKIIGLDLGADDYMVKPFNPMELVSRIRAIFRRAGRSNGHLDSSDNIISGDLRIDINSHKMYKNNIEIILTHREYSLIKVLMENIEKAFSREELLNLAWGEDFIGEYKTVDVHIRRLREKLEDNPKEPKYIKTLWGHGYRFHKF
ncbi:response regulator transcription factor [Oceanirhabdus sp. W0125-5]|uniref:response regulator transcription factor n=1 Tax=Oceanirhabdus sp. W0125-5 TaxID=2999116 RepID=UPI0022F33FFE|nr:response regulator transcription factor [Oceanirhabdus sp. W0125-5]WBW96246.1 response regulator transcription factor [Oceanirhabdus sp. W0125-5]